MVPAPLKPPATAFGLDEPGVRRRWGSALTRALALAVVLSGSVRAAPAPTLAETSEIDPCAQAIGQTDLNECWAREAERADAEMEAVYRALRSKLPSRASSSLEKAQKLWREFRDAHVATLYGVDKPLAVWGREYPMCVSISLYVMSRDRTRELRRLLSPGPDTVCPL